MSLDPTSLVVPAVFAGSVAILATVAIERLGGRIGGILGTLPTTIVPASWGILAQSGSDEAFVASMAAVPVGMGINGLFLWSWRVLPGRLPEASLQARLAMMVCASLTLWAVVAAMSNALFAAMVGAGLPSWGIGATAVVVLGTAGVAACWHPPPAPAGGKPVGMAALLARGSMAALAIAGCIVVASTGASVASGLASVFPAIFLTAMVSLWHAQGQAVPVGAVGPMILGSTSVSVYALLAAVWMPGLGGVGSGLAWVVAVGVTSLPASWFLRTRRLLLDHG